MNPVNIFSPDIRRADYERAFHFLMNKGAVNRADELILNPATLRLEAVLTASQNQYTFELRSSGNSDGALERKLNQNDLFFMTDLALCIRQQDTSTTPEQQGNFPLFTYPDVENFPGVTAGVTEAESLETIYNGELSFYTKPVERISKLITNHFRYVPEKQVVPAPSGTTLIGQTVANLAGYGPGFEERGFMRVNPNLILDGYDSNEITLTLGAGDSSVIAGGVDSGGSPVNTSNRVVLLLHGFEAKNLAQKMARHYTAM